MATATAAGAAPAPAVPATRATAAAGEVTPVAVDVTFLRMDARPAGPGPALPPEASVVRAARCTPRFYRYLYDTVGGEYLWWFRRTLSERSLAAALSNPAVSVDVLYLDGEPAGFHELERRPGGVTNLSYFGLMPHAVGRGLGAALLRHALDAAWAEPWCGAVTVNTCTADHPRALPNYLAAGFRVLRVVREEWPVPVRLGLRVPERVRG